MKLTKQIERTITDDWHSQYPNLSVYKPRHLLRRAGPLLIGICLDSDSLGDTYRPCLHCHFLGQEFPVVSLTICDQLKNASGGPEYIEIDSHESLYVSASTRLNDQSPLPFDESSVSLGSAVNAYRKYMETPIGLRQYAILTSDIIGLMVLCNRRSAANEELERVLSIDDESIFRTFGGKAEFTRKMLFNIQNPDELENLVAAQIKNLRLSKISSSEMEC